MGGEQRGRRLDHPVGAHVQFDRDDSSIASPMRVPGVQHGPAQRLQRGLVRGRCAQRREEVRLHHVLDGEGDLLLAGEVAEEGALGDVDGLGDLVDGGPLVPLG